MKFKFKPIYIFLIILLIGGLIFILNLGPSEKKIKADLKNIGTTYYENFYWEQLDKITDDKSAYLQEYKDSGLKFNLITLMQSDNKANKKITKMIKKKKCNANNTKIIIYPKESYGKKDYTYKINIECK